MKKKDMEHHIYLESRFYYCLFVIIFVFTLFISVIVMGSRTGIMQTGTVDYESDWVDKNGVPVSFDNLMQKDHIVIQKKTNGDIINNKSLCFFSKNIYFTVFLNGEVIYNFRPDPPQVFGKSYGTFPQAITMPVLSDDGILTIEADNLYPGHPGVIRDVSLSSESYFVISEMQRSVPEFLMCILCYSMGLVMFFIGLFGKYFGDKRFEVMSLGVFTITASIWIATESSLLPLLTGLPVAVHFVDYMMLAVVPIPLILFASYITGNKESKVPLIIGAHSMLNIVISIVFASLNIKDYHETLWVSHAIIGLTVLSIVGFIIRSLIKKKLKKGVIVIVGLTFGIPFLVGIVELIRYRVAPQIYVSKPYFQYIVILFILLCSGYEFISLSEMTKKGQIADIMEKIAYTDALTGLLNREAYNDIIDATYEEPVSIAVVMLDMNHLKKVNDKLGHAMGDEYIKTLAKCIKDAFPDEKCFRMGGDEFLVFSKMKSSNPEFHKSLANLNKMIETYNNEKRKEIPLSVAIGFADYNSEKDRIEDIFRIADERMYEQKKKMKMEVGIS